MVSEATVKVLTTLAEVEEIRPWWESWQGNPDADIDLFLSFFRAGTQILRPHVIAIFRDGVPDAILVGRIDRRPMHFRIGYLRFKPKADILFLSPEH